jgi:ornithine cyclodeaminase/alanine dehydrogenase-like protein (mu-crystallin family)
MPASFGMYLPDAGGEVHVKGAYLPGARVFAVKTATGFYRNAGLGLPVSGGMTMVHDAVTGALRMLIADGGLLTELRTAAAADSGELRHALEAGLLEAGSVYGELTAVASGRLAGRTADDELTVADLTGLGIQDAAVAALAARLADEHGAGRDVPLGDW